ncbi:MAG: endonuclease MutS2 [Christensenellales bacterium]|jgi:DNA mismatch repair protein MutS2
MIAINNGKNLQWDQIIALLSEKATSQMGRAMALSVTPSDRIEEVKQLLSETSQAESVVLHRGSSPMQPFEDVSEVLARAMAQGVLSMGDLLRTAQMLRACGQIQAALLPHSERAAGLCAMASVLMPHAYLQQEISRCILSEEEMADTASATLSSLRRQIRQRNADIRDRLQSMIRQPSVQKYLQDALITQRSGRYVLPVRSEFRGSVPGIVHDQSSSGATLYIEPMAIVQINNDLRQLHVQERAEMDRVLGMLSEQVMNAAEDLQQNMRLMAGLDLIFARAVLARDMKAVKPDMNTDGRIHIKRGRHPLIPAGEVVPIDLWMGGDFTTLVITGPNTGGKTVTLKTVGLFTLMAQSGLFVPADEGTELALFEKVFADIGDEQSIEQSLSTFSSHMTQIVRILEMADENCLVLLDELGAGTDPTEGAALAIAILEYLLRRRVPTLATTHYSELKAYALTTPGISNASVEFDVATLRPTYKLSIGIPGQSNAFEISQRLGLSMGIIDRAREMIDSESVRFEEVLRSARQEKKRAAEEAELSRQALLEAQQARGEAIRARDQWTAQREAMFERAREQAGKIIDEAQQESRQILDEMRRMLKAGGDVKPHQAQELQRQLRLQADALSAGGKKPKSAPVPGEDLSEVSVGMTVLHRGLNQKAVVLSLPDGDGRLQIQAGVLKIMAHLSDLAAAAQPKGESGPRSEPAKRNITVGRGARTELDLRGQTLLDAQLSVDKYLDDAVLSGLTQVQVIHGKGTGALREGLRGYFERHPHVRSFREGAYGEGDAGVTVIELK